MNFKQRAFGFAKTVAIALIACVAAGGCGLIGRRAGRRGRQLGLAGRADLFGAAHDLDRAEYRAAVQSHDD